MASEYIVDFDDFCVPNHRLDLLDQIRSQVPNFQATLFTIPALCTVGWLGMMRRTRPWLDLVPHGWLHPHPRECEQWTAASTEEYVAQLQPLVMTMGFKAPGWQISDASYAVLHKAGYWIADQQYNRARRPAGLRYYEVEGDNRIHGHIGVLPGHNRMGNDIEVLLPRLLALKDAKFGFVRDHLEVQA